MPIETLIHTVFIGTCTVVATLAGINIIRRTLIHVLTHWENKIIKAQMADVEEQWCEDISDAQNCYNVSKHVGGNKSKQMELF